MTASTHFLLMVFGILVSVSVDEGKMFRAFRGNVSTLHMCFVTILELCDVQPSFQTAEIIPLKTL